MRGLVGRRHLLTGDKATRRFRQGYRFGSGPVLAVVQPGSLVEQWRVLRACVDADVIVISQAANTGLTGGNEQQTIVVPGTDSRFVVNYGGYSSDTINVTSNTNMTSMKGTTLISAINRRVPRCSR